MSQDSPDPVSIRSAAVPLVGGLCSVFIVSQFYRTAIAVIAPDLVRDLGLSAEQLGILTGAFFAASASMQIPVGVLLDRYGPRRVIPSLLSIAVLGGLVFASGQHAWQVILGQFMIGAGCSGVFMGGLVAFSRWFPADRFATVTAVTIAISILGTLLSGTPLAAVAQAFGWRGAFYGTAGLTAVLALVVFAVVRDAPPGHPYFTREPETLASTLRGVGQVIRSPALHRILAISFAAYASIITIRGLWGGPYLTDIHGLGAIDRGHVLLAMSTASLVGVLSYGPLDRVFDSRRRPVLIGGGITALLMLGLAALAAPPLWLVIALFCALGVSGAYYLLLLAHGRAFFPDHLVGRAMTTINFATFTGVGIFQVVTGVIVGQFPATEAGSVPEEAYRAVFAFLGICLAVALAIYAGVRDARPSEGNLSERAGSG